MDMFKKIESALCLDKMSKILDFDGYHIVGKVKKPSQQGVVLKAVNKIGKNFAIKFCRPHSEDKNILVDSVDQFAREIKILASLTHKNIVNVYTAGNAVWLDDEDRWSITEGVDNVDLHSEDITLYYIMDFIEGEDISSIFPELDRSGSVVQSSTPAPIGERLRLFEDLIYQISQALSYCHSKKVTHKDIKADNIRYSSDDSTFIIVDFGFARHIDSPQDGSTFVRTEEIDLISIKAQMYESNDLAQFCNLLLKVLPAFENEYDANRYYGIKLSLEKGKDSILENRYNSAEEFYRCITQYFIVSHEWKFQLKLNEYLCKDRFGKFCFKLRIPVSGSIYMTKEVQKIIDTPEFQRLRGVRQLGPTIFVFPGANHTRYEHSLGTYHLALKYVENVVNLAAFREICEPVDKAIKYIILSALLHDIGHYPYSHWIEEIDEFPKGLKLLRHEDRAREIISNSHISSFIDDQWRVNPDVVSNIIAGVHIENKERLLASFINSAIDVDKVDYLVRDSIHCGVNYGKGIDIERLLDSLYLNPSKKKMCLTDKGISCLLSLFACRNIMYQEVYWHKTVRACEAMFKRFFYEYIKREISNVDEITEYIDFGDDRFINTLYTKTKYASKDELLRLIKPFAFGGRRLYKPLYVFFKANVDEERTDTKNFFTKVLSTSDNKTLIQMGDDIAVALRRYTPKISPLDILVERTPTNDEHEIYNLQGLEIWNIRKQRFFSYPKELDSLNNYLSNNQQAYIFCNPQYVNQLRELCLDGKFDKVLGSIL